MKHETFNSILALLGIGLAAFTAWHQFGPSSDSISLVSEGRVEVGSTLEIVPFGAINAITGESRPVVGPVTWKIRVHNPSERSVSLVSFKVYLLSENGGQIYYSAMREKLSSYSPELPFQSLPENIPPNESRAYLVSLLIPYQADEDVENPCENDTNRLGDLEHCFLEKGRDLFGNQVKIMESGGEFLGSQWLTETSQPRFVVVIETADGSSFRTHLSFLPW